MAASTLTIRLTDDQQRQFRDATGQTVTELTLEPAAMGELSDQQLDGVVGGDGKKTPVVYVRYTMTTVTVTSAP